MPSLKAHFDGHSIVLDEPATLAVGQSVRVLVEPSRKQTPFVDRVVLPDFERLPLASGDTTQDISADRGGPCDRQA